MATITREKEVQVYQIIHPLDDEPEEKCSTIGLGPMHMTRSVKLSLFALQAYLLLMALLLLYSVLHQAGVFGH